MSNYRRYLIMFIGIIILIAMPISFACDDDTLTANDFSTDLNQYSGDAEDYVNIQPNEVNIEEGEQINITGDVYVDVLNNGYWGELNIKCSYNDSDGNLREYTSFYDGYSFKFSTGDFEGLKARDNPYLLTFNLVEDELFEDFQYTFGIDVVGEETVYLTVQSNGCPDDVIPDYETFEKKGELYVSAEYGDDNYDGSQLTPFATIKRALDENKILGGGYEVIVKSGQYYMQSYSISNNVTIRGKGEVVISNSGESYIFFLTGSNTVEFINLKITGGTNAAISGSSTVNGLGENINQGKVLNIINCTFEDNCGFVGVIVTYSKTTIINSTFSNNEATGTNGIFQGLISVRDGSLTVNYCNFLNNDVAINKPLIYSDVRGNANFNFWGSNFGPENSDIVGNIKVKTWIGVFAKLNDNEVLKGSNYNITVGYQYTNDSYNFKKLNVSMPVLNIDLSASIGILTPTNVNISNDVNSSYLSNFKGGEQISVKLDGIELSHIDFAVKEAVLDRIYVSTAGNDSNSGEFASPLKTVGAAILKNKALGGAKTIIIEAGTYEEHDLEITNPVSILAESKNSVIIEGVENGRILIIASSVDIVNITFKNALIDDFDEYYGMGGAIYHYSGNLTITGCEFENNTAFSGGAIASIVEEDAYLKIINSSFKLNSISQSGDCKGSAIFSHSKIIIDNSVFTRNGADNIHGTLYLENSSNIHNSTFISNKAVCGGSIYVNAGDNSLININDNKFISNSAKNGGAIYIKSSNRTIVENNNFTQNTADSGGAIYFYGLTSNNRALNNIFNGNSIYVKNANVDWKNNTILNSSKAHIILDGGFISSLVLIFNNNETIKLQNGTIQINATLKDDVGNIVDGGKISFTTDGVLIGEADVNDGFSSLNYYFADGDYVISGNYSNALGDYQINNCLLRINVVNYWFINETGFETLTEAVDGAGVGDVIRGIPGVYEIDQIQIGHRTRPDEPWVINKEITITSLTNESITLIGLGKNIFNIDYYSNVTLINLILTGARNPEGWGGAVHSMGKNTVKIENCIFKDNYAYDGAGIHSYGNLYVNNTLFIDNEAAVYGGALLKDGDGDLVVENTKFINNTAYTYAGAVYTMGYSDTTQIFKNIIFDGNNATCGGALFTSGKNVTFISCNFTNNKAVDKQSGYDPLGGAVYVHHGATNFTNVKFINNSAQGNGGALQLNNGAISGYNSSGKFFEILWAVLNNCVIENNTASGDGGAIYSDEIWTRVNITNSIIKNNTAKNAVLFVNICGFYTLENVVVENNKNTGGDSLVYTYGIFSIPESFYADTTIKNSTFINCDANVIKSTTQYSSVHISDSKFAGVGMILVSDLSNSTLVNNIEINPNAIYSLNNNGNLSLKNNTFTNPIFTTGVIETPTYIIVMDNKTYSAIAFKNFTITAKVFDDNSNSIIGDKLIFIINDTLLSADIDKNIYTANYTVPLYDNVITASYGEAGLVNVCVKSSVLISKLAVQIIADDLEFNLTGMLNATILGVNETPIENASVIIYLNGNAINKTTDKNGFITQDLQLNGGIYQAEIKFIATGKYNETSKFINIAVNKLVSSFDFEIGDAKAMEDISITVRMLEDATGRVVVNIDNKNFTADVQNGRCDIVLSALTAGYFPVNITYTGDGRYYSSNKTTQLKVTKTSSYVNVNVDDVVVGNMAVVNVNLPDDATGNVIITINQKDYLSQVSGGKTTVNIPSVAVGNYTVEINYFGDKKYLNSTNTTSFNVIAKPLMKESKITIMDVNMTCLRGYLQDIDGNPIGDELIKYSVGEASGNTKTSNNGSFTISVNENSLIYIEFSGNTYFYKSNATFNTSILNPVKLKSQFNLNQSQTIVTYVVDLQAGEKAKSLPVILTDANGKPIQNAEVLFTYKNTVLNTITDKNGVVRIYLSTNIANSYICTLSYGGDETHNATSISFIFKLNKKPIIINAKAKTFKKSAKTKKYSVTLKTKKCASSNGKVYLKSGKKVTMKLNGKKYSSKINAKGKAIFKLKITKKGKFSAIIKFGGDKTYNSASKKVKITIK